MIKLQKLKGETFALMAAFFLGLNAVLGRFLVINISPVLPWLSRMPIAICFMLVIFYLKNKELYFLRLKRNYLLQLFGSVFTYALAGITFYTSLKYLYAGTGAIIEKFDVIFVFLISVFCIKDEKYSHHKLLGSLLVLLGAFILLFQGVGITYLGFFLCLASTFFFAISSIFDKKLRRNLSTDTITFYKILFTFFIVSLYVTLTGEIKYMDIIIQNLFYIVIFAINAVLLIYFYIHSFQYIDISIAAPLRATSPFFTYILALIFLKEQITIQGIISAIFIILGAILLSKHKRNGIKITNSAP